MGKKISESTINEVKELEKLGFTRIEISKQLGISDATIRHYLSTKQKEHAVITPEIIEKMRNLRSQGLSNSKIAIELNIDQRTVLKYLGRQPTGIKAEYGSIVSHATGESFIKKEESRLKKISTKVSYAGDRFKYDVDSTGFVEFSDSPVGAITVLTKEELNTFIKELTELNTWLEQNSTTHALLLDGKPRSQTKQLPL